jgi:adenylate kinase
MMRVVLLGPPGAGKSTQAARLASRLRVAQVTSSEVLRAAAQSNSQEARAIGRAMAAGELVPSALVNRLVLARLRQPDCARGFVLDGYPRTDEQAEALSAAGLSPDRLIEIVLDDAEVITRLTGRRVHEASGRTYHVRFQPPRIEGRDDITGEPLHQRADDRDEVVRTRLAVYHAQVKAILAHYEAAGTGTGLRHLRVDGRGSPEIVFERIRQALERSRDPGIRSGDRERPPGETRP